jgi:ATP-dependent exoDNAse (exonuclease V) alpha subunit
MRHLVSFAAGNKCRLILPGDSRQHHSVERGDALRILEKSALVASAALTKIFRQQVRREIVVERNGERRTQAGKFSLFRAGTIALSVGDTIRITKNFRANGTRFRNNGLHTVTAVEAGKITVGSGELPNRGALHLDQGILVTSHASQGKTVAQVIVSVPVEAFSQANEAQFYVSMSRARKSMHLFTDSKVALREAVTRKSTRL